MSNTRLKQKVIRSLAVTFRTAIIRADAGRLPINLRTFPLGACGDATLLLSHFLEENNQPGAMFVSGLRGKYSHAWLEMDRVLIDITPDQFLHDQQGILAVRLPPTNSCGVIVTTKRDWHSQFESEGQHLARIDGYDRVTNQQLAETYRQILSCVRDAPNSQQICLFSGMVGGSCLDKFDSTRERRGKS